MYEDRIGIQIVASRADCLSLLLQSLRTQTLQEFDIIIVVQDEKVVMHHPNRMLITWLRGEGHRVKVLKASDEKGIGALRNMALENDDCEYGCRIDDDSVCDPNYLKRLHNVIKNDNLRQTKKEGLLVGGIVPTLKKHYKMPRKFNEFELTKNGFKLTDHCVGFYPQATKEYYESDHIRSSFMYENDKARQIRFPTYNDDIAGFREETDFCIRWKKRYKHIYFVPKAVCWHLQAPYGGTRPDWFKYKEAGAKEADKRFLREMRKLYEKDKVQKHKRKGKRKKA